MKRRARGRTHPSSFILHPSSFILQKVWSGSVSRILCRAFASVKIIRLPLALLRWSSNLPGSFRWRRATPLLPYLVLLRRGFAMPSPLTRDAVRSYRTVSPLPALNELWRSILCCTFRRVAAPGCYPACCPLEFGLSSALRQAQGGDPPIRSTREQDNRVGGVKFR